MSWRSSSATVPRSWRLFSLMCSVGEGLTGRFGSADMVFSYEVGKLGSPEEESFNDCYSNNLRILAKKVQQPVSHGLEAYIRGDLIGKTLGDKNATAAQIVVTDHPAALDLRLRVEVLVAFVDLNAATTALSPHAHFPNDALTLRALNDRLGNFDF